MSQSQHDNPFAPPLAEVAELRPVHPDEPVLADRGLRLAAFALDVAAILVLLTLVSQWTPWDPFSNRHTRVWDLDLAPALWSAGAFLLINLYPLLRRSQTVGKALLGLRVVRPDGSPPSVWRLIGLRHLVWMLGGLTSGLSVLVTLLDALFIFGERRRCLHDRLADTVVVKA